jgi:hypothetical protein
MSTSIFDYCPPTPGGYLVGTNDHTRKVAWISPVTRALIATGKGLAHLGRTAAFSAIRMPDNCLHLSIFTETPDAWSSITNGNFARAFVPAQLVGLAPKLVNWGVSHQSTWMNGQRMLLILDNITQAWGLSTDEIRTIIANPAMSLLALTSETTATLLRQQLNGYVRIKAVFGEGTEAVSPPPPPFSLGLGQFAIRNQRQWDSFTTVIWSTGTERM